MITCSTAAGPSSLVSIKMKVVIPRSEAVEGLVAFRKRAAPMILLNKDPNQTIAVPVRFVSCAAKGK